MSVIHPGTLCPAVWRLYKPSNAILRPSFSYIVHLARLGFLWKRARLHKSTVVVVIIIIYLFIYYYFQAHQHKSAGRKSRLDILVNFNLLLLFRHQRDDSDLFQTCNQGLRQLMAPFDRTRRTCLKWVVIVSRKPEWWSQLQQPRACLARRFSIASDAAHEEDNCTLVNARNLSPFGRPKISSNPNDMFKPPSVQGRVRRHYGFGLSVRVCVRTSVHQLLVSDLSSLQNMAYIRSSELL